MTEREKIINIMQSVRYCKPDSGCGGCKYDAELDNYSYVSCRTLRIADALLEAGIGDVKEAWHRAEKVERAFRNFLAEYLTAVNEQNSYDCGIPEMFGRYANILPYEDIVTSRLNEYLDEAEKEPAEEEEE